MRTIREVSFIPAVLAIFTFRCSPPENIKVLVRMMDTQEEYFRQEVVSGFHDPHYGPVEVIDYGNVDSLESEMAKYPAKVSLVKIPFEKSWGLVRKRKIIPLQSFLAPGEIKEFNDTYLFTFLGRQNNVQYFVPRKYETRIMVYRKSKVNRVVTIWKVYGDAINDELKRFNGYGLPDNYTLENNPNLWDYYDIFVVGWLWAHTDFDGTMKPRIAHRSKRYSGTSHRIIDRVFQCGGDSAAVVTMQGDAVLDAFQWEAVYAAAGIYNPGMLAEEWSGSDIWKGFADEGVFLSFMTQLDCFYLHGTGADGLKGFCPDPDDLGFATMPVGCSFDLGQDGKPLRTGTKAITTGGWWWGVPADAPDPRLSYALARFITSKENQVQECGRFGMLPIRKDLRREMDSLFSADWTKILYDISYQQVVFNRSNIVPRHPHYDQIDALYLDAWFDIVTQRNWSQNKDIPDRYYIQKVLEIKYMPHIRRTR